MCKCTEKELYDLVQRTFVNDTRFRWEPHRNGVIVWLNGDKYLVDYDLTVQTMHIGLPLPKRSLNDKIYIEVAFTNRLLKKWEAMKKELPEYDFPAMNIKCGKCGSTFEYTGAVDLHVKALADQFIRVHSVCEL